MDPASRPGGVLSEFDSQLIWRGVTNVTVPTVYTELLLLLVTGCTCIGEVAAACFHCNLVLPAVPCAMHGVSMLDNVKRQDSPGIRPAL